MKSATRLDDFWVQPAKGFARAEAPGLAEAELRAIEERAELALPATYRELMKLQNGGYLRRRTFHRGAELHQIFINGAGVDPVDLEAPKLAHYRDVLEWCLSVEEIEQAAGTERPF